MARRTTSIREKRQEAEAAEARGLDKPAKATKAKAAGAKARTTRKKTKAPERKRLSWVIYSGTQKEFARFRYDQKSEAEAKLEEVKAKGRKHYYLQPVKELLSQGGNAEQAEAEEVEDE